MSLLSWIAEQALSSKLGRIAGGMVGATMAAVSSVDSAAASADRRALDKARDRNGGCPHVQLAFSSGAFSAGAPREANDGDRAKTTMYGKRFKYNDMTKLFWHPSVEFVPDGPIDRIFVGSSEPIPEQSKLATLRSSRPFKGRVTCPFCSADTQKKMNELEKYRKELGGR